MPQMFSLNRPTAFSLRLLLLLSLVTWLVGSPPLIASAPEGCREALPLPLDHSIHGYATDREPARYAIDVPMPCLLVTEAHATGSPPASPAVRFLDRTCRPQAANLPLPAIRGRHVHRVSMPGTYYVEIVTADLAAGSFRLDAWLVPDPESAGMLKDGGAVNEEPPREPMDEWDERLEIEGGWCPWPERPGLLGTFTCAPQLRVDESRTLTVHPLFPETTELVGLTLAAAGRIALETTGDSGGSAALFDAQGRLIAELVNGDPIQLAAGRYYLQVEIPAGGDAIRLDAELD